MAAAGQREHVVEDLIVVGKIDRRSGGHGDHTRLKRLVLLSEDDALRLARRGLLERLRIDDGNRGNGSFLDDRLYRAIHGAGGCGRRSSAAQRQDRRDTAGGEVHPRKDTPGRAREPQGLESVVCDGLELQEI